MRQIADLFIAKMLDYRVIKECDKNVYAYGVRALIQKFIFTCILFLAAVMVNEVIYTVIFYVSYKEIRGVYGNFHSKNRITCFGWTSFICLIAYIMKVQVLDYIPVLYLVIWMSAIFLMLILVRKNKVRTPVRYAGSALLYLIFVFSCIYKIGMGMYGIFMGFFCTGLLEAVHYMGLFVNEKNLKSIEV